MEMSLHFRVHAQLRKEGKSAFIADRFVLRRRVRQRCHLQWTDSCRGVVGSQTLMDMCSPEPCQGTFRLPSMGGGIIFCRLLHILNAFKSKDCRISAWWPDFCFCLHKIWCLNLWDYCAQLYFLLMTIKYGYQMCHLRVYHYHDSWMFLEVHENRSVCGSLEASSNSSIKK